MNIPAVIDEIQRQIKKLGLVKVSETTAHCQEKVVILLPFLRKTIAYCPHCGTIGWVERP